MKAEVHLYHDDEEHRNNHHTMHIAKMNPKTHLLEVVRKFNTTLDDFHKPRHVTVEAGNIHFSYKPKHNYAVRYKSDVVLLDAEDRRIEEFQGPISFNKAGNCVMHNPTLKHDRRTYSNAFVAYELPPLPGMQIVDMTTDRTICEIPFDATQPMPLTHTGNATAEPLIKA